MASEYNSVKAFSDLVSRVGIEIPLIQRDYVQGRIHDIRGLQGRGDDASKALLKKYIGEQERRDNFINQLINALLCPETASMQLTFIYGTVEDTNANSLVHEKSLVPLDGQQRLTTLFLLANLLIYKQSSADLVAFESRSEFASLKKGLASFRYKTRPSSEAFCSALARETICETDGSISVRLKAQSWFGDEWSLDPSVQAMLQMLDGMESMLEGKDVKSMLENLVAGKGIEFELLDMQDYNLTDALYIKMNARGKQLTEFENWKSEFIGFLEDRHKEARYNGRIEESVLENVFGGCKPSLGEYFAYSIEHHWTDLFWKYCKDEILEHRRFVEGHPALSKGEKDCYPVIDSYFMNVFEKITQILFFEINPAKKEASDYKPSKETRNAIYGSAENVEKLFAYLDVLCDFDDAFFDSVFYVADNQNTRQNCRVRLFDGKGVNLLTRCAKNADSYDSSNTLLYALLKYVREFGAAVDDDMKFYARSVRNCIEGKQYLLNKDVSMTYDFRINDFCSKGVAQYIDSLIEQKRNGSLPVYSSDVAAIEDFDFVCGNMKISVAEVSPDMVYEVLKAWNSLQGVEKQQLLIAYGFRGHYIMDCGHGRLRFFGADARWKSLFVHDDRNNGGNLDAAIGGIIADYVSLSGASGVEALLQLLAAKKRDANAFDFKYYALNYGTFLGAHVRGRNPGYYFSVRGELDALDLIACAYSSKPTLAYHTDPVVFAVKEQLVERPVDSSVQTLYLAYRTAGPNRAFLCVYDSRQDDPAHIKAVFRHDAGIHGQGGWSRLDTVSGAVLDSRKDAEGVDRIVAGVNYVAEIFPDSKFEEHG